MKKKIMDSQDYGMDTSDIRECIWTLKAPNIIFRTTERES